MKIKNLLLITCTCICALVAQAQNNKFQLSGNIKGITPFKSIYAYMMNEQESSYKVEVTNNQFVINGEITQPTICKIIFGGTSQFTKGDNYSFIPYKCSSMWVVISPNDKLVINGDLTGKDFVDLYYKGNEANKKLSELMSKLFPPMNKHGRNAVYLMKNKDLSQDKVNEIKKQQELLSLQEEKTKFEFLNKNYNSIAALWLMEDMLIRSQIRFEKLIPIFTKVNKNKFGKSQYYISIEQRIKANKNIAIGKKCPEIISNESFDNSLIKLSNFKGKYIILDFWGTWCSPCVKGIPSMKAFRDKNSGKVEILGIAKDKDKALWRNTITEKGMNWPNILNGKNEKDFVSSFNVQGYPTKILIDPNGIIRYIESGESESFYTNIDKIINGTTKNNTEISNNVCRVIVNATNYPVNKLLFSLSKQSGSIERHTIDLVDGKGYIDLPVTSNQRVYIQNMDQNYIIKTPEGGQIMPILSKLFAEPGKTVTISFDNLEWPNINLKGTTLNEDFSLLNNQITPIQKEERELIKELFNCTDENKKKDINTKRTFLDKKLSDLEFNYICSNPSKQLSIIVANDKYKLFSTEQIYKLVQVLRPYWENTEEYKAINEYIKIRANVQIGKAAPNFVKVDKNGKEISLQDYKGKYVLIDFWGTWCSPCRKSHPHLKALYEKYNPKGLELICVASEGKNANIDKWLTAINDDQLQGVQILNETNIEKCDMVKSFNIEAFPTKVVVDPAGKIAFITKGTGEAIDIFLEKTFGN